MIGSESASAAQKQTLKEVVNGSDGLSVIGFDPSGKRRVEPADQLVPKRKKRMKNQKATRAQAR